MCRQQSIYMCRQQSIYMCRQQSIYMCRQQRKLTNKYGALVYSIQFRNSEIYYINANSLNLISNFRPSPGQKCSPELKPVTANPMVLTIRKFGNPMVLTIRKLGNLMVLTIRK